MGQQIRRALCDWLRHECATRPLMLVLEDLHWGDAPTVVAIDEVLGQLEDQPLFVLALGRPELSDRFADLWLDRDVEHVVVGGLPPRASARLIRSVLGDEVPESTVRRLVQHAAGNAFFLEELIRGEARGLGETAPGTVLAMVQARLEALSAGARRLLRAGSIFGRVFSSRGVAALVGVESDAEELEACLRELWEREVLSHRKLGAGTHDEEHSFRHDLVREAAYGMLTDADRVLGHQLAADWLIAEGQTDAAALAAHFELGGRPDDAVAWVCVAARQALEGNDLQAALAFVRAGERCGAAGDRLGVLRFVEAQVLTARGELSEARARAVSSVGLFERGSTPWFDALGEVSVVSGRLGDWPLALDVARALLEHEEVPADARVAAAIAAARTTGTALFVGRMDLADGLLERAERWAGVAGRADPTIAAHLELTRCLRSFSADHPLQSVWHAEAARRHFEATGNVRGAAVMQVNLGLGLTELGDSSRAEAVLRQARAEAEQTGHRPSSWSATMNLGYVFFLRGDLERASAFLHEALDGFAHQKAVRLEANVRVRLARVLAAQGRLADAEGEARRAVELAASLAPLLAYAHGVLAQVLLASRQAAAATEHAQRAMAILGEIGMAPEGDELIRLVHAEALEATGAHDEARAALASARGVLLARADRLPDPAMRAAFLGQSAERIRTLRST